MKRLILILTIYFIAGAVFAQSNPPKREFRSAWIATVVNLDWPSWPGQSVESQKEDLREILDGLKEAGLNSVVFQIRSECDAMYASSYEPWSYWLTGSQGTPPSPFYDPLEFAVEEAHKRGMELHAWFNPYRAERSVGSYPLSPEHVTVEHPDWAIQIGGIKFLDPGLPMVREYLVDVIMDVVNRYDVDGVHFDDYFYPYPPNEITNEDAQTFNDYPNGFTNLGDWRRNNVNLLVEMVHTAINASKPWVKFGISPFGIWKNGVPPGIVGLDAYSTIYCDAIAWLNAQTIDYLTPQLYWKIGGGQDYSLLMPWWADNINQRHLYPGHALYRVESNNWSASEIPNQIRLNREEPNCDGSVFFRASNVLVNPKGFTDTLKQDLYRYPALMPVMSWKDDIPPNPVQNLQFNLITGTESSGLNWDIPDQAGDGDTAWQYVVYQFDNPNIIPSGLDDPAHIDGISIHNKFIPEPPETNLGTTYFVVTALDRINNESSMSAVLEVSSPAIPQLAYPADGAADLPDNIPLSWQLAQDASYYDVQVTLDPTFNEIDFQYDKVDSASLTITGLLGIQTYYWRVRAINAAGYSDYSQAFSFTTGFPVIPEIVYPEDVTTEIPVDPVYVWNTSEAAETYRIQVSKSAVFDATTMIVNESGLTDTTFISPELITNRIYFWRVSADNSIGWSGWSYVYRFKTTPVSDIIAENSQPAEFGLEQNYPNPFNPSTTIKFSLEVSGFASLKIYDILGREILTLVEESLTAGSYSVKFNASGLNSGIYIYHLSSNGKSDSRKMILLK